MFSYEEELQNEIRDLKKQISIKDELTKLLMTQVVDLSMMSKIELGDDVIAEIRRLKTLLKEDENGEG